jgi:transposase-like protein
MEETPLAWSKLGAHLTDPDKAREYTEFLRWGNAGPACPHCGGADPYKLQPKAGSSTRKGVYKCRIKECRKQFTATVGTVFEDSRIPLNKWLQAIYLMGASKKGISAHQIHRMLGVTYRSAWFMAHRLRYAMSSEPFEQLSGVVEVDETYMGGKHKGGKGRKRDVLKIDVPFEDAVSAFLRTPPPPVGTPGSRKVKPKGKTRKRSQGNP